MGSPATPVIRRLEKATVNRIAAGEVIIRPANALKELIENSLDAKSTSITVVLKQGGLKVLQIQDNGCGIRVEDFPILCERFTTSKIKTFEDLTGIKSFGFRGEALASISHVAHLTITSKTPGASCAYRASFEDGKLIAGAPGEPAEPRPVAGLKGTTIHAEDLFYNIPIRREALRSPQEEYRKCVDVVTRYAVHYAGVSFVCKKQSQSKTDVHTMKNASRKQNIRALYGKTISRELIEVNAESKEFKFKMESLATNPNFNTKTYTFILFINNRLVESVTIKKAVDSVYKEYLPSHSHPFVYLNLDIHPSHVDVNVHPTKKEVGFLHEEHIVEEIRTAFENALKGANSSRIFLTQTLLPGAEEPIENKKTSKKGVEDVQGQGETKTESRSSRKRVYEHKLVRTDSNNPIGRLDAYLRHPKQNVLAARRRASSFKKQRTRLTSVRELYVDVESVSSDLLCEMFGDHTFVGCVDNVYSLIQHKTKLSLINVPLLSRHLMYERVLLNFGYMEKLQLSKPAPLRELLTLALETEGDNDWSKEEGGIELVANKLRDLLVSKSALLKEYFSIVISEKSELIALPEIIPNYVPPMAKLPGFLLRLSLDVNWSEEKPCFQGIADELALFYQIEGGRYLDHSITYSAHKKQHISLKWVIQHTILPAMSYDFHPPRSLEGAGCTIQVACLEELYKIFERC